MVTALGVAVVQVQGRLVPLSQTKRRRNFRESLFRRLQLGFGVIGFIAHARLNLVELG